MITLKLASYTNEECERLERILRTVVHDLAKDCRCHTTDCATCDLRHLCGSFARALNYAENYNATRH